MRNVFDLDGTLVDTREANLRAYKSLGVTPPDNFHQTPWQEWATREQHDAKNRLLSDTLPLYGKPLPLLQTALELKESVVLSNCSDLALVHLTKAFPELLYLRIFNRLTPADKAKFIRVNYGHERGVYYDDSLLTCHLVQEETGWQTVHVLGGKS